ncbi:hypothetical protein LF65_02262 [Clostridium beijerinckii]|uniref:Uncharacterized protein n=1 Tax=Clostridium beijerinckii TaxID=1520 RepID=A0A0B5QPP5_CLOBE|nr:hypothetical protein LF65_02262 [Clostridium beijerinckii]
MEKPILFNTEMVKSILEGRKWCTRRIAKTLKDVTEITHGDFKWSYNQIWMNDETLMLHAPYDKGDILYVRETWMMQSMSNFDKRAKFLFKAEPNEKLKEVVLSSDRYEDLIKYSYKKGWQPSLFMPKEAARIFLKVTNVRVERLKNMTTKDVLKEGIYSEIFENYFGESKSKLMFEVWENLWNSTLKKDQLEEYGWNANPWVWVIEFERIEK